MIPFQLSAQKIELEIIFNDTLLRPTKLFAYSKNISLENLKVELNTFITKLNSQAYLTATIDSIIIENNKYQTYIHLGKQFKWTYLKTKGIDEEVLSKIGFRDKIFTNRPFSARQLYSFYEKLIVHYENNGFPFASIQLDSVKIEDNEVRALLVFNKNTLIKIDSVNVIGNATISERYIENYIRIKDGDFYNEFLIKNISNRIKELPFVQEATPFKVIFTEKESKILLNLQKKKASRFN